MNERKKATKRRSPQQVTPEEMDIAKKLFFTNEPVVERSDKDFYHDEYGMTKDEYNALPFEKRQELIMLPPEENRIIYDWFSVTSKSLNPQDFINILGLDSINFAQTTGFYGYSNRLYYNGIHIHYGGGEKLNGTVLLEMSGRGCRLFEQCGNGDWDSLLNNAVTDEDFNVTRLDVAFDDRSGLLDIDNLSMLTKFGWYISRKSSYDIQFSSKGTTVYVGSKQSDTLVRFYDKAAQQGLIGEHWIRSEIQLRRECAVNFIKNLEHMTLGQNYGGVINGFVTYVEPKDNSEWDINVRRWKTQQFWLDFVVTTQKINIHSKGDVEYTLERAEEYVFNQAGNCIEVILKCKGVETFLQSLGTRLTHLNKFQQNIIDNYIKTVEDNDVTSLPEHVLIAQSNVFQSANLFNKPESSVFMMPLSKYVHPWEQYE